MRRPGDCIAINRDLGMISAQSDGLDMFQEAFQYLVEERSVFPVCSPSWGPHEHFREGRMQPCINPGKTPMVPWKRFQSRPATEDELAYWWRKWPDANIGMATGAISNVVVLDADGIEARKTVMRQGIPETPVIFTGRDDGTHYWFKHPGFDTKNFAGKLEHVDFRGDGGYVLLPPSLHANGRRYRWAPHTINLPLAPVPDWLLSLLSGPSDSTDHEPLDLSIINEGIPEGSRDETLWRYACKLRADGLAIDYARQLVVQAARNCRPPFDEAAALEKVDRAYREYEGGVHVALEFSASADIVVPAAPRFTLLTGDDIENMPPLQWLADAWLPAGGLSTLYGPSGAGKSFAALDLCLSVANGTEWLDSIPVKQGPVVYVLAEGIGGLKQRQRAWLARHPGCTTENIRYVATAVSLLDPAQVQEIIAAIRAQFTEPVLIVLDTLARAIVGGDENSAKDMGIAVQSADTIRAAFKCHVLLVHHTGRNGDHERGSSALYAGLDASIYLSADNGSVQLQSKKVKDSAEPEPIGLKLVPVEDTDSCVLTIFDNSGMLTKIAADLLVCLATSFPHNEGASTSKWQEASACPGGQFFRGRTALIDSGLVMKQEGRFGANVLTEIGLDEFFRMKAGR